MAAALARLQLDTGGSAMSHTLFLGVGNTLLSDEGAGVHALRHVEARITARDDIKFLDAGTLSFVLADAIAEASNIIIFDAAEFDAGPGSVRVFEGRAFDDFLLGGKRSVHEVGFADLMDIARLQDCLPENRALIGIQPGAFGWGEQPGEAVMAALPRAAVLAIEILERWTHQPLRRVVGA
jgi:hydrogenase maturation protease